MKLLIVIGTVNFHGGAHVATWAMIDALKARGVEAEILTGCEPNEEMKERLKDVPIHMMEDPFPRKGLRFFVQGICRRLRIGWVPNWTIDPSGTWRKKAAQYDTVLVIGENSHYRSLIGSVKGPKKVVFIHTDYVSWRTASSYNRVDARCDKWTYRKFDKIAVVGKPNAERFAAAFPEFKEKVCAFHNIFEFTRGEISPRKRNEVFSTVSISRLNWGPQKKTELAIEVAAKLKAKGLRFKWTIFGDGPEEDVRKLRAYAKELQVEDCFFMPGYTNNQKAEICAADVTTLLSAYEGMSNAIYESLLFGTPVIATDVGGASEQIEDGRTGYVVPLDVDKIAEKFAMIITHPAIVESWRGNLAAYQYDNAKVVDEYMEILG